MTDGFGVDGGGSTAVEAMLTVGGHGETKPVVPSVSIGTLRIKEQSIRRTWHNQEWWFSVVNVCAVLTGSADAGAYWHKLKQRLNEESGEPVTFRHGLKLQAPDGKQRINDCANAEGLFRLIQSIPSPKSRTLQALVGTGGYEQVKEIENPELASARVHAHP